MKRLIPRAWLSVALTVATAVGVTAQAMSAPPRPYKARDIVPVTETMQAALAAVCQMYPTDCRMRADGSIERVVGRRIVPGADRDLVRHLRTEIGPVLDPSWRPQ